MGTSKSSAIRSTDLTDQIRETLNRVEYGGERLFVTRHGRPAAMLVACTVDDIAEYESLEAETASAS